MALSISATLWHKSDNFYYTYSYLLCLSICFRIVCNFNERSSISSNKNGQGCFAFDILSNCKHIALESAEVSCFKHVKKDSFFQKRMHRVINLMQSIPLFPGISSSLFHIICFHHIANTLSRMSMENINPYLARLHARFSFIYLRLSERYNFCVFYPVSPLLSLLFFHF